MESAEREWPCLLCGEKVKHFSSGNTGGKQQSSHLYWAQYVDVETAKSQMRVNGKCIVVKSYELQSCPRGGIVETCSSDPTCSIWAPLKEESGPEIFGYVKKSP